MPGVVYCTSVIGLFLIWLPSSHAHGRLWDPPGRSTMWRRGFNVPTNYDDNELFCGGFSHQVSLGYKCGLCGDPWDGVRENEAGGRFATGQISRAYLQGSTISVTVQLTANHMGFFEFKVCPVNNGQVRATQACLDLYPLRLADGSGVRYPITTAMGAAFLNISVTLPANLVCSQCVLQWRYHAGNNWGTNADDGRACIGCGPQEEFYGCADIQIVPPGVLIPRTILDEQEVPNNIAPIVTLTLSGNNTQVNSGNAGQTGSGSSAGSGATSGNTDYSVLTSGNGSNSGTNSGNAGLTSGNGSNSGTSSGNAGLTSGNGSNSGTGSGNAGPNTSSVNGEYIVCRGVRADHNDWCQLNCQRNNCPASHCSCTVGQYQHANPQPTGCRGAGIYASLPGYHAWCRNNCALNFCPSSICVCT